MADNDPQAKPEAEKYDRDGWLERVRWFKHENGGSVNRHVLAGALHDLKGQITKAQVEQRLAKYMTPPKDAT